MSGRTESTAVMSRRNKGRVATPLLDLGGAR
jgi:hypothetical protein